MKIKVNSKNLILCCLCLLVVTTPRGAYASVVAQYLFDEGNGAVAIDSSGNGNHGTIVGSTYINDTPFTYGDNYALEFHGLIAPLQPADCYVTIPDAPSLRPQAQGTIEAWVKTTLADNPWNSHIVTKQIGSEGRDSYALWYASNESIFFWVEASNGFVYWSIPSIDEWHHVAGVWDESTIKLYIDGTLMDSQIRSGTIPYDDNPVLIGADDNNDDNIPDEVWNGVIDEVIIHDQALTDQEVYDSATNSAGPGNFNTDPVSDAGGPYIMAVEQTIMLDGSGSYDDDGDTLSYLWTQLDILGYFDDPASENPGYTGSQAGITDLTLTVSDGQASDSDTTMLVVYDQSGGFVTGGGWIYSAQGAYIPNPLFEGRANFGFVSKYTKGASTPTGNTEFVFKAADLNFHSDSYDWLIVNQAGANAQFKGSGTINNNDYCKFILWAQDDAVGDTFRIKIWKEFGEIEEVIYDNGFDQPISGGSIIVHKGKN